MMYHAYVGHPMACLRSVLAAVPATRTQILPMAQDTQHKKLQLLLVWSAH